MGTAFTRFGPMAPSGGPPNSNSIWIRYADDEFAVSGFSYSLSHVPQWSPSNGVGMMLLFCDGLKQPSSYISSIDYTTVTLLGSLNLSVWQNICFVYTYVYRPAPL